MNNKRATKRALLTSVMALVMCVVMLVGTTFAWFTDTASTGVNKIQAGNLKMEVQYRTSNAEGTDSATWKSLTDKTDLFGTEGTLFEPGHTRVVELKIKNAGNLAFKYKIGMNVVSEQLGTNKDGREYKLSNYLKVAATAIQAYPAEGGIADVMEWAIFQRGDYGMWTEHDFAAFELEKADNNEFLYLTPGKEAILGMKVYMPEDVGNEANARTSDEAASISFGLNVSATQYTVESDSFGSDYDKDATYLAPGTQVDSEVAFREAVAKGGEVSMTSNIELTSPLKIEKDVVIHGNGYAIIYADSATSRWMVSAKTAGTALTLDGIVFDGSSKVENAQGAVIDTEEVDLTISNCEFTGFTVPKIICAGGNPNGKGTNVKITNTSLHGNKCEGINVGSDDYYARSSLLHFFSAYVTLENVSITGNTVSAGGIAANAAGNNNLIYIKNSWNSSLTADGITITDNSKCSIIGTYTFGPGEGKIVLNSGNIDNGGSMWICGDLKIGSGMTVKCGEISGWNSSTAKALSIENNGTLNCSLARYGSGLETIYTGTGTHTGTKTGVTG